jgi:hypothetical protein
MSRVDEIKDKMDGFVDEEVKTRMGKLKALIDANKKVILVAAVSFFVGCLCGALGMI